jgi:AdoMet-dependent heme synthase
MAHGEMKSTSVYKGFQIRDGHGIVFVSNLGEIYPSGFLPLRCGNLRVDSLVDVYRSSAIFRGLHSPDQFHGKCGACEYSHICGGSRARAFCLYRRRTRHRPILSLRAECALAR